MTEREPLEYFLPGGSRGRTREALGRFFPLPLVATALLLVALILFTPVLQSAGQPAAGTILTEAELIVDRGPVNNTTHFYVTGLGATTRYAEITIAQATGFNWSGGFPDGPLNWSVGAQSTDVITVTLATSANPVALNITVLYSTSSGSAYYMGKFAFYVGYPAGSTVLTLNGVTTTPGISLGTPKPVADLPLPVPLAYVGSGP